MKRINSTRRVATAAALLAFAGWSTMVAANDAVTKGSGIAPAVPSNTRLVHLALGEITAIAAQKGWLQEEFAKYNAKADLVNTSSYTGTATAVLLDRGDLHIIRAMVNFALQYPASGMDTRVIWGSGVVNEHRAQTIVLKDSAIKTVPELKGHKLATSILSCPYYASAEALRSQGVSVDSADQKGDVQYINITGIAATSAFLSGRFEGFALHPTTSTTASLFIQDQVRSLATAVPNGMYVNSGGRSMEFAIRTWVDENPDLVRAFLTAQDRVVRWLAADHGAHLDDAATITSRALRIPKSVALFGLKDLAQTAWEFGETDANDLTKALKKYQEYQLAVKDPLFTKAHLTEKQIEVLVDRRFFTGGEYFVDAGEKKKGGGGARGATLEGGADSAGTKLALTKAGR
jgi:sulfonate transport system substrate-binding protein